MSGRFWANVVSVLSGTAVAQAIPILGSLVLARLFVPEAYGGYAVWLGAVLIIAVVVTLRLEMALAVVGDGEEREEAFGLVLATILAVGLGLAAVAVPVWLAGLVPSAFHSPIMVFSTLVAAMLAATCDTWQAMAAADGAYGTLIKLRIAQATFIVALQIAASLFWRNAEALIAGHLCGLFLSLLFAATIRRVILPKRRGLPARVLGFWRAYPRFPLFALPADGINSVSAQLPLMILSARFGNESAGILALTMRVLGLPIALLGRSVLDVFRRHAAEAFRQRGDCRAEYVSTLKVLAAGSLLFVISTYLFAEPIFATAFGETWRTAGIMAIWLAPFFALRFVASPLSYIFYVAGRQNIDLIWQICLLATVVLALTLPHDVRATVIAYGYGYSAMYLIYLVLGYRSSKRAGR
jgi:O-antigen/teichoic acid export membrane protein